MYFPQKSEEVKICSLFLLSLSLSSFPPSPPQSVNFASRKPPSSSSLHQEREGGNLHINPEEKETIFVKSDKRRGGAISRIWHNDGGGGGESYEVPADCSSYTLEKSPTFFANRKRLLGGRRHVLPRNSWVTRHLSFSPFSFFFPLFAAYTFSSPPIW